MSSPEPLDFTSLRPTAESPLYLRVRISPNAPQTEIIGRMDDNETWKIRVHAPPEKNRANEELIRFLGKNYSLSVQILSGKTDRTKLLKCLPLPLTS